MCMPCHCELGSEFSEGSLRVLKQFFDEKIDVPARLNCRKLP